MVWFNASKFVEDELFIKYFVIIIDGIDFVEYDVCGFVFLGEELCWKKLCVEVVWLCL